MRGDSVRDLYAKTLALLGLGVLAGTGALVDYWPSQVELPVAEPGLARPQLTLALPTPAPTLPVIAARSDVRLSATVRAAEPGLPSLVLYEAQGVALGDVVALNAPPPTSLVPVPVYASAGEEVAFSDPVGAMAVATLAMASEPTLESSGDDRDWWITGAFKRTGSSIARTSMKTGSSVLDMFRVVNRAVRKALPD